MATRYREPVVVSYFTPDYSRVAQDLRWSLNAWGFEHRVDLVGDRGSWVANCAYKPKFIWRMMDVYQDRPVVWLDADCMIRKRPGLFMPGVIQEDVAACRYQKPNRNRHDEILSGTVFLNNTYGARKVVDRWIEECELHPEMWDQVGLARAIDANPWASVRYLPIEYAFIFDRHRKDFPGKEPVIEHFQHSRQAKARRGK